MGQLLHLQIGFFPLKWGFLWNSIDLFQYFFQNLMEKMALHWNRKEKWLFCSFKSSAEFDAPFSEKRNSCAASIYLLNLPWILNVMHISSKSEAVVLFWSIALESYGCDWLCVRSRPLEIGSSNFYILKSAGLFKVNGEVSLHYSLVWKWVSPSCRNMT